MSFITPPCINYVQYYPECAVLARVCTLSQAHLKYINEDVKYQRGTLPLLLMFFANTEDIRR